MTITIPGQTILMDTPSGIDPVWYGKLQAAFDAANQFGTGFGPNSSAAFSAHKNSVDQIVALATPSKVTFTSELFDVGGTYDATNSRWTPPAGIVQISAGLYVNGGQVNVLVYKNGAVFRGTFIVGTGQIAATVSITDNANGTDYYEIWGYISTAPNTVFGIPTYTWWTGIRRPA